MVAYKESTRASGEGETELGEKDVLHLRMFECFK